MREFRERETEQEQPAHEDDAMLLPAESGPRFTHGGEFPPVSENTAFESPRTASSFAFDDEQRTAKADAGGMQASPRTSTFTTPNGRYTIGCELVKVTKTEKVRKQVAPKKWVTSDEERTFDALKARVTFDPSDLVKSKQIGFVQVVRRSEDRGKSIATTKSKTMTDERVRRTDQKSGFRVDRDDDEASPFYGTDYNDNNELVAKEPQSNRIGRNPMMTDRAGITPNNHCEFITTATDIDSGRQFDAIRWGFKADASSVEMIEPELVPGDDEALIGRDRAIHRWNELANEGNEEAVPTQFDPVADAESLQLSIQSRSVDLIRSTLEKHGKDRSRRSKVQRHYKFATDSELSSDLKGVLDAKDEKTFKDWL